MRQDENSREIVNQRPFDAWTECVALLCAHFVVRNSLFAAFYSARIPVSGHFLVKFMRRVVAPSRRRFRFRMKSTRIWLAQAVAAYVVCMYTRINFTPSA